MISEILLAILLLSPATCQKTAPAALLFHDSFDTPASLRAGAYDTRYFDHRVEKGDLVFFYSSEAGSPPAGVECRLPGKAARPEEREIDVRLGGGGSEMSNSFFISYALGAGVGFCLPPFGYGAGANSRTGRRTGYIIRFLRHSDATNEIEIYRSDTGWVKKLTQAWLPANPVTALRRAYILHRKNGEHILTVTLDTGVRFQKTIAFEDNRYPPGPAQRGIQFIAKAHSATVLPMEYRIREWTVRDRAQPSIPFRRTESAADRGIDTILVTNPEDARPKALDFHREGKLIEARAVCRAVLQREPRDADILDLLGLIEVSLGNYSDGRQYLYEALSVHRTRHGDTHDKVAESLRHLAELHGDLEPKQAERFYEQCLEIYSRGPQLHPAVVDVYLGLANAQYVQGAADRAEATFHEALKTSVEIHGQDHIETAKVLRSLADFHRNRHAYRSAVPLYQRALAVFESTLGPDHPDVTALLYNLMMTYSGSGEDRDTGMLGYTERLVTNLEKQHGPDHPDLAMSLIRLGRLYSASGRYRDAEACAARAVEIREKVLGPRHIHTAEAQYNLASICSRLRQYGKAEEMIKKSMVILEEVLGLAHPILDECISNLANLYEVQGRKSEASPVLRKLLAARESRLGKHHPDTEKIRMKLAGR